MVSRALLGGLRPQRNVESAGNACSIHEQDIHDGGLVQQPIVNTGRHAVRECGMRGRSRAPTVSSGAFAMRWEGESAGVEECAGRGAINGSVQR